MAFFLSSKRGCFSLAFNVVVDHLVCAEECTLTDIYYIFLFSAWLSHYQFLVFPWCLHTCFLPEMAMVTSLLPFGIHGFWSLQQKISRKHKRKPEARRLNASEWMRSAEGCDERQLKVPWLLVLTLAHGVNLARWEHVHLSHITQWEYDLCGIKSGQF